MLSENHIINKQVFEFSCNTYEQAFVLQKEMDAGLQYNIQSCIGSVLDRYDDPAINVIINRIEIDLGEVDFNEMNRVLPGKIHAALSEELYALVTPVNHGYERDFVDEVEVIKFVEVFLLSGSLPWWVDKDNFSIDEAIGLLVKNQPHELNMFFLKHALNVNFIRRIFFQLSVSTLEKLIAFFPVLLQSRGIVENIDAYCLSKNNEKRNDDTRDHYIDVIDSTEDNGFVKMKLVNNKTEMNGSVSAVDAEADMHKETPGIVSPEILLNTLNNITASGEYTADALTSLLITEITTNERTYTTIRQDVQEMISKICNDFFEIKRMSEREKVKIFLPLTGKTGYNCFPIQQEEKIYIQNAGLILIGAFLPALFKELGFTNEGVFVNRQFQFRAVFLLHYICTGVTATPEYTLQLNKILCGLEMDEPIPFSMELTSVEKDEAQQFLQDVIGHWAILKATSVDAVRGSFLLRDALLSFKNNNWLLQVNRNGFDILLDKISWSWKTLRFNWMKFHIETEW